MRAHSSVPLLLLLAVPLAAQVHPEIVVAQDGRPVTDLQPRWFPN